jgi:protein-S-isoprenylcysteine O-methyltransferase Ste14
MNLILWIATALLVTVFLLAGATHAFRSLAMLAKDRRMQGVRELPPVFVRFIGVCELLGVAGLLLPALTGMLPWLTALAAAGLGGVMLCALIFHLARREFTAVPVVTVLLALAAFVAYGRAVLAPFS